MNLASGRKSRSRRPTGSKWAVRTSPRRRGRGPRAEAVPAVRSGWPMSRSASATMLEPSSRRRGPPLWGVWSCDASVGVDQDLAGAERPVARLVGGDLERLRDALEPGQPVRDVGVEPQRSSAASSAARRRWRRAQRREHSSDRPAAPAHQVQRRAPATMASATTRPVSRTSSSAWSSVADPPGPARRAAGGLEDDVDPASVRELPTDRPRPPPWRRAPRDAQSARRSRAAGPGVDRDHLRGSGRTRELERVAAHRPLADDRDAGAGLQPRRLDRGDGVGRGLEAGRPPGRRPLRAARRARAPARPRRRSGSRAGPSPRAARGGSRPRGLRGTARRRGKAATRCPPPACRGGARPPRRRPRAPRRSTRGRTAPPAGPAGAREPPRCRTSPRRTRAPPRSPTAGRPARVRERHADRTPGRATRGAAGPPNPWKRQARTPHPPRASTASAP